LFAPTAVALFAAAGSIAVKEWLYRITVDVADRFNSKVVNANAWHHRSDAISSAVCFVGIGGSMCGFPHLDAVSGILVSGMIVKEGVSIGLDSAKDLTDAALDDDVLESIGELMEVLEASGLGINKLFDLRGRRMGPYMTVDVCMSVNPRMSVTASHQVCERVRLSILATHPAISEVLVRLDVSTQDDDKHVPTSLKNLMRPQEEIERDVQQVLRKPRYSQIQGYTHFQCHYVDHRLTVQLQMVLDGSQRIRQAETLAKDLKEAIVEEILDVNSADIHLELSDAKSPVHTHARARETCKRT
jgi:divalent metal cation (Fe/Co/Zn/Cd) transporter